MNRTVFSVLLLAVVGHCSFLPALRGPFLYDDVDFVEENPYIRHFEPGRYLTTSFPPYRPEVGYYRPLTLASYALDYQVWGLNPFGYHLTNLFLHALAGIALWGLLRELGVPDPVPLLAGLVFLLHPVHAEGVAWIAGRSEILAGLFVLLGLWLYVRGQLGWACLSFAVGLCSKESAVIFVPWLILLHFTCRDQIHTPRRTGGAAVAALLVAWCAVRWWVLGGFGPQGGYRIAAEGGWTERIASSLSQIALYAQLALFPAGQSAHHVDLPPAWIGGLVLLAVLLLLGSRFRCSGLTWCAAGFLVSLAPFLNWVPIGDVAAERFLYLPLAAVATGIGAGGIEFGRARLGRAYPCFIILILVLFSCLSWNRASLWADEGRFWRWGHAESPRSDRMRAGLGERYAEKGEWEEALRRFREAWTLRETPAWGNAVAVCHWRMGEFDAALEWWDRTLELHPGFTAAYLNRGGMRLERGETERAVSDFRRAVETSPGNLEARQELGAFFVRAGRWEEAEHRFDEGLDLAPWHVPFLRGRVLTALHFQAYPAAAEALDRIRERESLTGQWWIPAARAYFGAGRFEEAVDWYRRGLQREPDSGELHYRLAEAALQTVPPRLDLVRRSVTMAQKHGFSVPERFREILDGLQYE